MIARHSLISMLDLSPVDACIQMSSEIPKMTVQELHIELPYVIRRVFSFSRFDWSLRDICNDQSQLYSIIHSFLSPWHGELWKGIVRLQDHSPPFTFQFNINDLPSHLRVRLSSIYAPDIVQGRSSNVPGQQINSLTLEPIEYFLFNLFVYGMSDENSIDRPMRTDSVYLRILEMYLCLFLPIDVEEFRLLLMTHTAASSGVSVQATHTTNDPRRISSPPVSSSPKKATGRQSFLFGGNAKQRDNESNQPLNMNSSTSSTIHSSQTPILPSTTTSDAHELMKKVDYFIKCFVTFFIDIFQPTKSVYGSVNGGISIQEFNLCDSQLLCVRMFIKRLHLFCSFQYGIGSKSSSLTAATGLTAIEQRNLLIPLQTLKKTCLDSYVRLPLYTLLQIGIIRCPLDQRYNTLLFIWYTYIRPWRYGQNFQSPDGHTSSLIDPTNVENDELSQDQSINNAENSSFAEKNIFFYGRLFQMAINRLQKTDLTNVLIAQMINKLSKVFSGKNFVNLLLQAERTAVQSSSMSPTAGKQRQIANFSSESPRPNFSLVSDENRAAMIGCLRRIAKILYRNERQIHEQNRISAENNLTKRNNSMSVTDSFIRNIFSSPTEKNNRINSLRKPTLPVEIVDILRNAKSNFMDLFEISPANIEPDPDDEESFDISFNGNKSLSTSITGTSLNASYSPYEMENPITSSANAFELRPLLWFNNQISKNLNSRYADKINELYHRPGFLGYFFRQIFFGPQDQLFHSIRTAQINFRYFADVRTLFLLILISLIFSWIFPDQSYVVRFIFMLFVIFLWNLFRAFQTYRQSIISS